MDYFQLLVSIMNLPEEQKGSLVNALIGLCQKGIPGAKYYFVPMDESITEDSARAKEYTRITQGEVAQWLYSNVNWGRVYKDLCREGLLVQSSHGVLMRLNARRS